MKLYNQVIRVFTPEAAGESCFARTTIGTWMSKLLPDLAAQRNFRSRPSGHISIFKPVLLGDGTTMWSWGENYLAVATSGAALEVYPFFREDTQCSVCELMPPPASPSGG